MGSDADRWGESFAVLLGVVGSWIILVRREGDEVINLHCDAALASGCSVLVFADLGYSFVSSQTICQKPSAGKIFCVEASLHL
jgi:hypothetical protein